MKEIRNQIPDGNLSLPHSKIQNAEGIKETFHRLVIYSIIEHTTNPDYARKKQKEGYLVTARIETHPNTHEIIQIQGC